MPQNYTSKQNKSLKKFETKTNRNRNQVKITHVSYILDDMHKKYLWKTKKYKIIQKKFSTIVQFYYIARKHNRNE